MTADRDLLIEALECSDVEFRITQIADALLPVVDRIARERAAAELRAAAKAVALTPGIKFHGAAVRDVLDRADALDPQ